jgi:isopenicillin-N N-acyltransferase-like protein
MDTWGNLLKYVALSGESSFARGLALGKMIKDVCTHSLSFFEQKLVEKGLTLEYGLRLALENEKVVAKHFPELLEEIRGVAEGAQLPYNSLLLETAYPFAAGASSSCTIISAFGSATRDRTPIVGRNYDFLSGFKKCNQLRSITGKKAEFSFVGGTITMLGVEEGMNNAGLFIGDAGWEPKELSSSRGLSSRQVMQLVLENCTSVDTAMDFISQTPKFANNAGTCYLLVDRREAVAMEMGLTKIRLRMPEEGIQVVSNVFLTSIAQEIKPPEPTALTRYNLAIKRLCENRGEVDKTLMRKLLADHSIPICSHNEINTLRSIIAKTNEKKMMVADGHPCTSKFEEILIPT